MLWNLTTNMFLKILTFSTHFKFSTIWVLDSAQEIFYSLPMFGLENIPYGLSYQCDDHFITVYQNIVGILNKEWFYLGQLFWLHTIAHNNYQCLNQSKIRHFCHSISLWSQYNLLKCVTNTSNPYNSCQLLTDNILLVFCHHIDF